MTPEVADHTALAWTLHDFNGLANRQVVMLVVLLGHHHRSYVSLVLGYAQLLFHRSRNGKAWKINRDLFILATAAFVAGLVSRACSFTWPRLQAMMSRGVPWTSCRASEMSQALLVVLRKAIGPRITRLVALLATFTPLVIFCRWFAVVHGTFTYDDLDILAGSSVPLHS